MMDIPDDQLPSPEPDSNISGLFKELPTTASSNQSSYRVLARKYRPQNFSDLIGQEAMVRTLRNAFAMGRVAHAFMLTGVRGVGKTTTARIIARALNCIGTDEHGGATADPCGVCVNCKAILADRHPDVLEIDAASHTGVDDVREIIEGSRFRPIQSRMKVYIIDEVHMLSRNAFNALLKTLEEPPEQVTFIFATTELRKVPVTVLSRCQRFDLRRVSQDQLAQHFTSVAQKEQISINSEAIHLIARAADGSVRDGLSLLDQAIAQEGKVGKTIDVISVADMLGFADRALIFDLFTAIMEGNADTVLNLTELAYANGADLGVVLSDLLDLTYLITRLKSMPKLRDQEALSEMEKKRGGMLADQLSIPVLGRTWQMLLKGIREVELAPNRRAAAEMILIRLCYVADLPTPGDLVTQVTQQNSENHSTPLLKSPASKKTSSSSVQGGTFLNAVEQKKGIVSSSAQLALKSESLPETNIYSGKIEVDKSSSVVDHKLHSWREVVAFVKKKQEMLLHAHLRNFVHLVRFEPPVIEIRTENGAASSLAQQLMKLLNRESSIRWTIVLSQQDGAPTLMEQEEIQAKTDRKQAAQEPFIQEILQIFPGAQIAKVTNLQLDEYGLFPETSELMIGREEEEQSRIDEDDQDPL